MGTLGCSNHYINGLCRSLKLGESRLQKEKMLVVVTHKIRYRDIYICTFYIHKVQIYVHICLSLTYAQFNHKKV